GDLPEGRLNDAADLRGLHLDAPSAEQAAEVPLLDRVEGAEDGGLAVLLEVVEHLFRLAALPVEVRNAACGGGLPSAQLLDRLGINLLRGLAHSHTSDDQEREHADDEQDEAVSEPVRDLPRVEDAGKDTVPDAVHDDRDDPLDHRGLHAGRKESKRLRRGNAPRDLSRHLLDLGRELAVPAAARDHDRVREGHAETPRLRDVAKEVWESSLDLLDLALLLGQEEAVGTDESHDRKHEPEEEPFDRLLAWPEGEVHRTDQVQEGDEAEEGHQGPSGRHDRRLAVRLLVEPDAGLFQFRVRHLSPPAPCSR